MATLLYGETPNADVEAGNRVDTADTLPPLSPDLAASPELVLPNADAALPATVPVMPPMRPKYPTPSPWAQTVSLRALVLALAAVAVLFAGLASFGIALVWSQAMTSFARIALMVIGGYLIAAGVAYIASVEHRASAPQP